MAVPPVAETNEERAVRLAMAVPPVAETNEERAVRLAMAVPPVAETNEERAVRLAMERDLGIERVENLPAEDGEKKGIKYSRAAADAVMSGPAVRAETNALWLSAIEAGDFDDDDAEGVKGLSTMAHGRLHAIRETTNSASPQQSSPSPAHLSSRASIAKKPAPYSPNHNPGKPPQLNNARHNITSQRPKRRRNVPSPTNGASRATAAKAAPPGLTNKAAAPGPANKAGQHPLVQKKSQLSNGHRNTQPANSSLLRNSSSYNLGPTKPPSTSQLSNIVLDESVLCLQGETILYRDVALLHQQAGTKPLPSSVIWLASGNVAEPQFIVVADNAILHEYPLSSWKTSWGTAPDRDIKFRDNLGIETTIRLTFINHTAVSLFVEKQDELATQFKKPSTVQDGSAQPKQTVSTMVPTTTGSHPPTDTGTPTKLKPSGTAKAAANTNETKTAPSNKSSSQKKAAAVVLQSSPALPGSKEASPPGVNVSKQRDAQSQTPDLSTSVPGPAEGSFSSSDIGGQLILLEDDRTAAVRGPSRDPRSLAHLQELHSLSPESPSSNALVLYDDQAHKTAAVDQAVTTDSVIAMCQAITVQVEQLTQVHIDMSRKARDAVRQRLDAGLSKSFRGIEDPKRSHVISTLMLLFDAATRHNGLRYSADEMHDLRSDAEPPRGHDYEQARKDLDDLGVMNPLRKSEVHKLQVAQVAAKQTEDTPGLQVESQAKAINASAAAGESSTLVDAESTEASTSLLAAAEISGADHSSPRITAVDTNVFGIETNDTMPCSVSATRALSLRRQSSRSNSVSSQVTQGGSRRVGLASSRWASGAATSNTHISASLISSSPVPNSPATTRSPPITSARPTTGSNSVMFSSRFAECIPRTSALFDLSSLEGGGGQSRVPSVESESPAGDECQVPERRSLGRGVRNINIPVSERGLRDSDITLI